MGANQGRAKGNEQKAEYGNLEGKHERSGWRERGKRRSESGSAHRESSCEAEPGREGKETQRLSSEMLKRKRRSSSGSQAPAPEEKSERGSPVEQLRERSREGRKETNRKLSTKTGRERTGNQPGRNGESKEAKAERQHRGSH